MAIVVSLYSDINGEIKRLLERFHGNGTKIDCDIEKWVYVYNKPLESLDIISAVMDNTDKYNISVSIRLNGREEHPITSDNYNDVVKGMFSLFYEEH